VTARKPRRWFTSRAEVVRTAAALCAAGAAGAALLMRLL
jgi:hypothetical protein